MPRQFSISYALFRLRGAWLAKQGLGERVLISNPAEPDAAGLTFRSWGTRPLPLTKQAKAVFEPARRVLLPSQQNGIRVNEERSREKCV